MVTRANLEKGVATLATLWGVQPYEVADRLAIALDFRHLEPAPLGETARRARRHENTKYSAKRRPYANRTFASVVPATAKMIDDPKTFRALRSMLMKAVRSKVQDPIQAEDLVQETLLALCLYEVKDEQHLFRLGRQVLRRVIAAYWRKAYNSPAVVTPHEDFYIIEEVLALSDETAEEGTGLPVTADLAEAFLRVAAELMKQLGKKQAAVACGMREKTFSRIIPL